MTADNIVTRWVARWFMRFEAAGNILRIMLFGGTFLTTGLSALAQYGYGDYALQFIAAAILGTVAFAYYNTEGGIYNQKNRDKMDAGQNFAGPEQLIDDVLIGTAHFAAREKRAPTAEEQAAIRQAVAEQWSEFRDGIDLDDVVGDAGQTPPAARARADGGTAALDAQCTQCNQQGTLGSHKGDPAVVCLGCGRILYRDNDPLEVNA